MLSLNWAAAFCSLRMAVIDDLIKTIKLQKQVGLHGEKRGEEKQNTERKKLR